jgi:PKD repeat protein
MNKAAAGSLATAMVTAAVLATTWLGTAGAIPTADAASATTTVANWQLNDAAGSTVMKDASGNGLDGQISPDAAAEGLTLDGSTYTWSDRCPACLPVQSGRVVVVPDDDRLDIPDPSVTYTVEVRFRTTKPFGNYLQKGQSTSTGGQIKVQGPNGIVQCLFKGADGVRVGTGSSTRLDDGAWHTVDCVRTPTQVQEWVDGVKQTFKNGSTGAINNKQPFTIGGKNDCNQVTITCDYFAGQIDYVTVTSTAASTNQPPVAAFSSWCSRSTCTFDSGSSADPDGTIVKRVWTFGDGTVSAAANPTHTYGASGTYSVGLTVTDDQGWTDHVTHDVTIAALAPGRPRSPTATRGDGSALVTWKAPASSGSDAITQYTVTGAPDGQTCTTANLRCRVTDLGNGHAYTFTVVAHSVAGDGAASVSTDPVVPAGKPLAPSSVTARAGTRRATVTWSAAAPNGRPILRYVITSYPDGAVTLVGPTVRRLTFTGLVGGRRYHFTVAARNLIGTGPATTSNTVRPGKPG